MVSTPSFLFIQQILDEILHMPGVILGARDWVVQKTEKVLALLEPEI